MMDKIQYVDREFVNTLFSSGGDKYEPKGKFLCKDTSSDRTVYVAVDNTTGDAFTEEFDSRWMATRWLHGKAATNIHGERLER